MSSIKISKDISEALLLFIESGSANGNEKMRRKCREFVKKNSQTDDAAPSKVNPGPGMTGRPTRTP